MDIFNVLSLFGGIAMFLFGMTYMGDALKKLAGNQMKLILSKVTSKPIQGFLVGLLVTMIIQSSTATNVMVLSFVNAQMMTLVQAIPLVIGANLGTTITAWIISLSSINGVGFFLKLLKPSSFSPVLLLIGVILFRFIKQQRKQDVGKILIGFALLMYGMTTMSGSMSGLSSMPSFTAIINALSNPFLGLLTGIIVAAIMQSSSASIGILQALALSGSISFATVIPMVMGINIGQVVPVLIASSGTSRDAKRLAATDLMINVSSAVICLPIYIILTTAGAFPFNSALAAPVTIAITHSSYKLISAVWQLPGRKLFEVLSDKLVKERKNVKPALLDSRFLATPALALAQVKLKIGECIRACNDSFEVTLSLFDKWDESAAQQVHDMEEMVDYYQNEIDSYLSTLSSRSMTDKESRELSKLLRIIADAENISDHIYHMVYCLRKMNEGGNEFPEVAKNELKELAKDTEEILRLSEILFYEEDKEVAMQIISTESHLLNSCHTYSEAHVERLKKDASRIAIGTYFSDMLLDMQRISDHISRGPKLLLLN